MGSVESIYQNPMFNHEKIQINQAKIQQVSHFFKRSRGTFAMAVIGDK